MSVCSNEFSRMVAEEYLSFFNFTGLGLDQALRWEHTVQLFKYMKTRQWNISYVCYLPLTLLIWIQWKKLQMFWLHLCWCVKHCSLEGSSGLTVRLFVSTVSDRVHSVCCCFTFIFICTDFPLTVTFKWGATEETATALCFKIRSSVHN